MIAVYSEKRLNYCTGTDYLYGDLQRNPFHTGLVWPVKTKPLASPFGGSDSSNYIRDQNFVLIKLIILSTTETNLYHCNYPIIHSFVCVHLLCLLRRFVLWDGNIVCPHTSSCLYSKNSRSSSAYEQMTIKLHSSIHCVIIHCRCIIHPKFNVFHSHIQLLGVFHSLALAKNTIWTRPCLRAYRGFPRRKATCLKGVIVVQQWEPVVIVTHVLIVIPWPSPGWTPLCLCYHKLDHLGLRRTGTAPERLCHPRG
jgi:hypothetical protein